MTSIIIHGIFSCKIESLIRLQPLIKEK